MTEQDIIALHKQIIQEEYSSIYSPLTYIGDKRYHFIEQEIPSGNLLILLPKEFINLPPVVARLKYPSSDRPKCIKSSVDTSINFAFSHLLNYKVRENELLGIRNTALDGLKKLHPQNDYLDVGLDYWGQNKSFLYSWFEYISPTLDAESYSFNAFMRKDECLLFYLFNCPNEGHEHWRPIIFETILSIRDKPIGWEEGK